MAASSCRNPAVDWKGPAQHFPPSVLQMVADQLSEPTGLVIKLAQFYSSHTNSGNASTEEHKWIISQNTMMHTLSKYSSLLSLF